MSDTRATDATLAARVADLDSLTSAAADTGAGPAPDFAQAAASAREAFLAAYRPDGDGAAGAVLEFQRAFLTAAKRWERDGFADVNAPADAAAAARELGSAAPALHRRGVAAFEAGDADAAAELLRNAVGEAVDLELLNDLAVICDLDGRPEEADALLRACLAIDPDRTDARENLDALAARMAERRSAQPARPLDPKPLTSEPAAWRLAATLGGDDPSCPERAYPGMGMPDVMSDHASRYAFVLQHVGGMNVLDLGCGTGYGSEMLTWTAASVRGFDLWQPEAHEHPLWPGGAELNYGHDLCRDPLPRADAAVMFEVIEHLGDAPAALRTAFGAVDMIIASFPNPLYHGSQVNDYHVNDWTLDQFERELEAAARTRFGALQLRHLYQLGEGLLTAGRNPEASYWIVVARGVDPRW
jgi:2-polyprenyl-3-methyl-5-hydroxy-6-metoxy-1,4-benzoquinol methylase